MGGQDTKLTGPDFRAGISLKDLAPDKPLLGHADGSPVLMTRIGDEVFAVGASCTHYGGPLAEGLVMGDTVRCPWHHACFSLRNGEALRSPALNPLPCWKVERNGDRITVGDKVERPPLEASYPFKATKTPKSVVVVGAGAAGSAAIEMLRRCGYSGPITAIDPDESAPYDRPNLSKDYLAGNAPEEWIPLRPPGFYEEHGVRVVRTPASRVDTAKKTVAAGKEEIPFDALILATGASPIELRIPGGDSPKVHYLRSLADSRKLIKAIDGRKTAVVAGASFIGLEVAASLRARGLEVHVVAPEALPLERVLGAALGEFIRTLHTEKGVQFHLGRKPASVTDRGVTLDDGSSIDADVVVFGVGVRPRLELAEAAGLKMDRGVIVNAMLETSAAGVYAVGDIARFPDARTGEPIRVEHWVVAQRMGQVAARNVLGANEAFDHAPFFWSAHYDVSINYVGHAEKIEKVETDGSAEQHDFSARLESADGKVMALATIFRDTESLEVEVEMEKQASRGH
jgi:NADPH-dependent 2,4-dienoyl-CoA reductase/sulfur reductase-like enzyme/nitrite reductase/ring-hydroxylating ferredoxin subunit